MEKNWRKHTQKWPEPWISWGGTIEQGDGFVEISEEEMKQITYSIWYRPAGLPSEVHEWGGAIWPVSLFDLTQLGEHLSIELEDGRRGKITPASRWNNLIVFRGTGDYPG